MIGCDEARDLAGLQAADETDAAGTAALEEHLRSCAACAAEAARARDLIETMRGEAAPDPGALYWASFDDRLRRRLAARPRLGRPALLAGLAAAAALLLVAGLAYERQRERRPGGPRPEAEEGAVAEERLDAALRSAADRGASVREIRAVLDEMVPGNPYDDDVTGEAEPGPDPAAPRDGAAGNESGREVL